MQAARCSESRELELADTDRKNGFELGEKLRMVVKRGQSQRLVVDVGKRKS